METKPESMFAGQSLLSAPFSTDYASGAEPENQPPALAVSGLVFTHKDIMDGLRELYSEWCVMKAKEEGLIQIRLPDYEAMIDGLDRYGLPTPAENKTTATD